MIECRDCGEDEHEDDAINERCRSCWRKRRSAELRGKDLREALTGIGRSLDKLSNTTFGKKQA